ncbi:hypothetical protein Ga0609869_000893 [Rhodovulum iodosum]|uniref:Flavinylation-associated cytochrome domain-containing protein n=1 Tax=Rhodovulum iodosum TaxID=68291 RepID=A0ABV3XRW9_9RHOB|nr:DUF4405 domain-containing protein [Rhodovulum robiginosum]RSK33021.1 DUF4405 domain-containing protein [Rhodovulum robiginosum]
MPLVRKFATPLTIGAFLLMSVTGLLMFFHASTMTNKVVHEWVGLIFVAAALLHVFVNLRPFTAHMKRARGQAAVAVFALALGLSFLPLAGGTGGGRPDFALLHAIEEAPLGAVAAVLDESPETLTARLRQAGYDGATADSTISDLAHGERGAQMRLIAVLIGRQAEG